MSIDINWAALTDGPDGAALAETIREFIHERFQQVTLPRFIRSVKVHSFDFGSVAPDIAIKDVCDPLPDFYENEEEDDDSIDGGDEHREPATNAQKPYDDLTARNTSRNASPEKRAKPNEPVARPRQPGRLDTRFRPGSAIFTPFDAHNSFLLSRASTPGIPGGTSNLSYFHLPLGAGLSGTTTPLAAVAGAQFGAGWPDPHHTARQSATDKVGHFWASKPPSPPSESNLSDASSKSTRDRSPEHQSKQSSKKKHAEKHHDDDNNDDDDDADSVHEKSVNDVQIISRIKYNGDIKLSLTADILLDYPMPSFVGIPLKLSVTGMTFDGVAILAYIRKKAHFCFLSPEDADALVGGELDLDINSEPFKDAQQAGKHTVGALFEEIKVESEIGQGANGKQVLKNVGKVEKFVLEQVRRIFENEFVYPSFWTFLV